MKINLNSITVESTTVQNSEYFLNEKIKIIVKKECPCYKNAE
tara:strand:- start:522 stop:647 length:126 start_codon:yes stop_codon:yes gene_type:complete